MVTDTSSHTAPVPDYEAIKTRQRAMWGSGNYAVVGSMIHYMSERLCEDVDLSAGQTSLDIATGPGNAAIAAARRGAQATGIDYVQSLLDVAERRSGAEGLKVNFQLADAENLPFDDHSFDIVTSVCGVMFAPNQERAAAEMVRVCKTGGRIAIANWTPDGFVGSMLKTASAFVPPPPGLQPTVRWGIREGVQALLGAGADLEFIDLQFVFRFQTAEEFADIFIRTFGPTERAHASLDAEGKVKFRQALTDLAVGRNRSTDGTIKIPSAYLMTIATPHSA